ncbi:MAG: MATE family efflux transporter, partial [Evtepia sp.]|nr:MATE family efflux transporter [Evtepia sp.]
MSENAIGRPSGSPTLPENKMGVMPIKKLVISMALPMMFSMLVQALYNIVDSYFVARLSEDALAAVT